MSAPYSDVLEPYETCDTSFELDFDGMPMAHFIHSLYSISGHGTFDYVVENADGMAGTKPDWTVARDGDDRPAALSIGIWVEIVMMLLPEAS